MTSRTGKPIVIADYDPAWPARFRNERALILDACGREPFRRIEHVGSTAVPDLAAKPIIDIMPGLHSLSGADALIAPLSSIGYEYVPEYERANAFDDGMPERRYFRKDVRGERAFHMHMVEAGSDFWRTHLMFRNALRTSPRDRQEYERVKRRIAAEYNRSVTAESNVNRGYTDRKSDCISDIMSGARERIAANDPIVIETHNPNWAVEFERERNALAAAAKGISSGIEHVGSTSVPGLAARPVVDIAVLIPAIAASQRLEKPLASLGYRPDARRSSSGRLFVRQGSGAAFRLHVLPSGSGHWQSMLAFREWLRGNPDGAAGYERLKRQLAAEFGNDLLGYAEAKSEYIEETLQKTRAPRGI